MVSVKRDIQKNYQSVKSGGSHPWCCLLRLPEAPERQSREDISDRVRSRNNREPQYYIGIIIEMETMAAGMMSC
jgi:hypothetical protein